MSSPAEQFTCQTCGKIHGGPALNYSMRAPVSYDILPWWKRKLRCEISSDQCVIAGQHFFVLGNINIPIIGDDRHFSWSVWVSLSQDNFIRTQELWKVEGRESEPPYFGWLNNHIPIYPETTLNLPTAVHTQALGLRPLIVLEPSDHMLSAEQRQGITWDRVREISHLVDHQPGDHQQRI